VIKWNNVSTKQESAAAKNSGTKKPPLVVGTICMGFGHHQIAYAATSWGLGDTNRDVYFHDLLNIESEEANMIKIQIKCIPNLVGLLPNGVDRLKNCGAV
jgi:hypothetical protein